MLGATLAQVAFNIGNAVGAFLGGIPITLNYSYEYVAFPGIFLAAIGFFLLLYFIKTTRNETIE